MAILLYDLFESVLTNKNGDWNIKGVLKIKTEFGLTNYLYPIGVGCFNSKTSRHGRPVQKNKNFLKAARRTRSKMTQEGPRRGRPHSEGGLAVWRISTNLCQ